MVRIQISCDASQVTNELDRLLRGPGAETFLGYNAAFAEAFAEVVAIVHVETGSLKSTAKFESPNYPEGWQGTIRLGGAAPGMLRDPAYYGVYELARGGTHFFFAPAYADIPDSIIETTLKFFAGGEGEALSVLPKAPSPGGVGKQTAEDVSKNSILEKVYGKGNTNPEERFQKFYTEEAKKTADEWNKKAASEVGKLSGRVMSKSDVETRAERIKRYNETLPQTVVDESTGRRTSGRRVAKKRPRKFYLDEG